MNRKQLIEKEIERVMSSLDHLSPAHPAPFFYTRLNARMMREEKNIWGRLSRAITRPVTAGICVTFIIAVNIFVVLHHPSKLLSGMPEQTEIAVADEYSRTTNFYNIYNVQP